MIGDNQGHFKILAFLLVLPGIHAYITSSLEYFHSSLTGHSTFRLSLLIHCLKCTTENYSWVKTITYSWVKTKMKNKNKDGEDVAQPQLHSLLMSMGIGRGLEKCLTLSTNVEHHHHQHILWLSLCVFLDLGIGYMAVFTLWNSIDSTK